MADGEANDVYGVTSTIGSRKWIKDAKVKPFTYGTVGGITGALLNEGMIRKVNVLGLLAEVSEDSPDARAAANVIKAIDELLLAIELDPRSSMNICRFHEYGYEIQGIVNESFQFYHAFSSRSCTLE